MLKNLLIDPYIDSLDAGAMYVIPIVVTFMYLSIWLESLIR